MDDTYTTIEHRCRCETKVQGSRFIADVFPVGERVQAEEALEDIRKTLHDATHHCYAYRIGKKGEMYRLHDDGEPGGTAGRPILAAIDRHGLTDVLVIVTRYFGGTKLGVGGLARAYGDAAEQALREAGERICYLTEPCTVRFAHAHTAAVMRIVSQLHARIVETKYDEQVLMTLEIRRSLAARLRDELTGALRGQVEFDPV
ncbi:MAG: hypothetical protein H6Q31_814 [Bacteroidetes bacterium]|jgi:uncharacterized YigZ family protein|nr:hypothetical protein [Bacteroidota bacterium]